MGLLENEQSTTRSGVSCCRPLCRIFSNGVPALSHGYSPTHMAAWVSGSSVLFPAVCRVETKIPRSICFSARSDYFSNIRSFAEPAVRFYDKVYLSSFTLQETREYAAAVFGRSSQLIELSDWLYAKTFGHPYFLAFVSRQLLALARTHLSEPERLWPTIFRRLEQEKFRSDLAHGTEREVQLLREVARAEDDEISPRELGGQYDRNYFMRLTEKSLLVRVGRGRYKLYHPLFRLFLKEG